VYPKIVFFGTPSFAAEILHSLIDAGVPIAGIVTQPDRPKGRSLQVIPSEVKIVAEQRLRDVPIFQPIKSSNADFLAQLRSLHADLYVVVAFGQILPQSLLDIPKLGCINIHASLLPKYRGAAPMQRALMAGEKETGVAIQKMVRELDAGDVIATAKVAVAEDTVLGELHDALCAVSKPLLLDVLRKYTHGVPPAVAQDVSQVTWAPKILPEETELHWEQDAKTLHNTVRALSPKPGAWVWVELNGEKKRLKIFRTHVVSGKAPVGEVASLKELVVGCGNNLLQLVEVQLEGKPRMKGPDWARGLKTPIRFL